MKPKTKKNIFSADSKTCRVFSGFEQPFSTSAWQVMQLQVHAENQGFCPTLPPVKVLTTYAQY